MNNHPKRQTKNRKQERGVQCDNCRHIMPEKEYDDMPECPMCGGHYVTVVPLTRCFCDCCTETKDRELKAFFGKMPPHEKDFVQPLMAAFIKYPKEHPNASQLTPGRIKEEELKYSNLYRTIVGVITDFTRR